MTRRRPSTISRKSASAALWQMLCYCKAEMLATFTPEVLSRSWNVPQPKVEEMLARARRARG